MILMQFRMNHESLCISFFCIALYEFECRIFFSPSLTRFSSLCFKIQAAQTDLQYYNVFETRKRNILRKALGLVISISEQLEEVDL